jgi:hypothetical protein
MKAIKFGKFTNAGKSDFYGTLALNDQYRDRDIEQGKGNVVPEFWNEFPTSDLREWFDELDSQDADWSRVNVSDLEKALVAEGFKIESRMELTQDGERIRYPISTLILK